MVYTVLENIGSLLYVRITPSWLSLFYHSAIKWTIITFQLDIQFITFFLDYFFYPKFLLIIFLYYKTFFRPIWCVSFSNSPFASWFLTNLDFVLPHSAHFHNIIVLPLLVFETLGFIFFCMFFTAYAIRFHLCLITSLMPIFCLL